MWFLFRVPNPTTTRRRCFLLSRSALFMYRNLIELYTVTVDYMFITFYQASYMDSELMDHIIKHWKMDQRMNIVYRAGERVLLSPLFITVFSISSFLFYSFLLMHRNCIFPVHNTRCRCFVRSELHCHCIIKDFWLNNFIQA